MGATDEQIQEAVARAQEANSNLNSAVAIIVALVATSLAVFNIKDGNMSVAGFLGWSLHPDTLARLLS